MDFRLPFLLLASFEADEDDEEDEDVEEVAADADLVVDIRVLQSHLRRGGKKNVLMSFTILSRFAPSTFYLSPQNGAFNMKSNPRRPPSLPFLFFLIAATSRFLVFVAPEHVNEYRLLER